MDVSRRSFIEKNTNQQVNQPETNKFLHGLDLSKETLSLLNRIKGSAPQTILNDNEKSPSTSLSEHKISGNSVPKEPPSVNKIANKNLLKDSTHSQYESNPDIKDLNEFILELPHLFGKDKEFLTSLLQPIKELKKAYVENNENTHELAIKKKKEIKQKIVNWVFKSQRATDELKVVANLLKGDQIQRVINQSATVNQTFETIKGNLKKLEKKDINPTSTKIIDPLQRKEAFRNITIMKEKSQELLSIEKQTKTTFSFLNPIRKFQMKKLEKSCEEIKNLATKYEDALAFTDNEKNDFSDLTIESRHPRREHLLMYANDIFEGAKKLIEKQRAEGREKIFNEVGEVNQKIKEDTRREVFNDLLAGKDLSKYETQNDTGFLFLINDYKNKLFQLEDKLTSFEKKIEELGNRAALHPDIVGENANRMELLSKNAKESATQQEKAKSAINGLYQELKVEYSKLSRLDDKQAAKELTEARNEVLSDKSRWDRPIERTIEIHGKKNGTIQHTMSCQNSGYPSSGNRGRQIDGVVDGKEVKPYDCIQPNLHKVEISNKQGELVSTYTSSATNVEFFQRDEGKRDKATLQQTGEILMGKIDTKLNSLSEEERQTQGTIDKPVTIDVMNTLLLSPDSLRDWLVKENSLGKANKDKLKELGNKWWMPNSMGKTIKKELDHIGDPSQLEKRMLDESIKAWMSFDISNPNSEMSNVPEQKFEFKDKEGNIRTLHREVNDKGKQLFYIENEGKKTYVQFDISCYNVGCNKMTKMMTNTIRGKSFETIAKKIVSIARFFGLPVTSYSGESGNKIEEKLNNIAFKKDTIRYEAKLEKMSQQKEELKKLNLKDRPTIENFENSIVFSKLSYMRTQLEDLERNPKATPKQKEEAFRNWQQARNDVGRQIESAINQPNISPDMKKYLEIMQHEENLRDLFHEIKDQFDLKDYRSEKGMDRNMYSLPSTLVLFGMELDAHPHTGCRSGKDRTSLQRIEIGTRVLSKEVNGRYLNFREIEQAPETYEIREQMLLNSGHIDDLARLNIGSVGLNLSGAHGSYLKRVGSDGKNYNAQFEKGVSLGAGKTFAIKL